MSAQQDVGILDANGNLTEEAKNSFIHMVLVVLEYGTENIPESDKPKVPFPEKLDPDPTFKNVKNNPSYLRDKQKFAAFHKNWIGRYQKLARDLNVKPNFSLLPILADPIAVAGSGFKAEIESPTFPDGFASYFTGALPLKLIADLVESGDDNTKAKFLSPAGPVTIISELSKLVSPPAPPAPAPPVITPPPLPPGFSLPDADPNRSAQFDLSPEQIIANLPKPPEVKLSALSEKEFSAVQNLPKALADVIAKVPSFLTKISNPGELIGEVAKIVKDSGMLGPKPKETSYLEKAAQAVLSVKIAEMKFVAAYASTMGSSPGCATVGITQITSSPRQEFKYLAPKRKKPAKQKKLTPGEKAYLRGSGLAGSSYGNSSTKDRYLKGLFYKESILAGYDPHTINLYGGLVEDGEQLQLGPEGADKTLEGNDNDLNFISKIKATPIDNPAGFYEVVSDENTSSGLSSCGMFVRACLAAGGAYNDFFLSFYPFAQAIQMVQNIGFMRNYRWVSEKWDQYDINNVPDGKRAILNDLFEIKKNEQGEWGIPTDRPDDTPLGIKLPGIQLPPGSSSHTVKDLKNALFGTETEKIGFVGKNSRYTKKYENEKNPKEKLSKATVAFAGDWVLDCDPATRTMKPSERLNFLSAYLKSEEERVIFYGKDIGRMLKDPDNLFPALDRGDAILTVRTRPVQQGKDVKQEKDWETNGEHILLVGTKRSPGFSFFIPKKGTFQLKESIRGIEGGSLDDHNTMNEKRSNTFKDRVAINALLTAAIHQVGDARNFPDLEGMTESKKAQILDVFDNGGQNSTGLEVKKGELVLVGEVEKPRPTAVLKTNNDLGFAGFNPAAVNDALVDVTLQLYKTDPNNYISNNESGVGFFLGCTVLSRTKPEKNLQTISQGGDAGLHPKSRRIIAIFKTNNFCNDAENKGPFSDLVKKYIDETIVNDVFKAHLDVYSIRKTFAHRVFRDGKIARTQKEQEAYDEAVGKKNKK